MTKESSISLIRYTNMRLSPFFSFAAAVSSVFACDSCNGAKEVVHERHVRRMQPGASPAKSGPRGPLEWGQLNFLQTVSCLLCLKNSIFES